MRRPTTTSLLARRDLVLLAALLALVGGSYVLQRSWKAATGTALPLWAAPALPWLAAQPAGGAAYRAQLQPVEMLRNTFFFRSSGAALHTATARTLIPA